jgi:nephrocystin-3
LIAPDTPDRRDPLNNLGTIDSARNRMEAARKEYEEAVKIYRELAEKNPENYLPEVAQMLNNLGLIDSPGPDGRGSEGIRGGA